MPAKRPDPSEAAESCLRAALAYNIEAGILPSENRIIARLLAERAEMRPVYAELVRKLPTEVERCAVLRRLVSLAAFWSPTHSKGVRDQIERAERLNREIETKARELAQLLRDRAAACPDVRTPADYHPLDLIERAAESSADAYKAHAFRSWVRDPLAALRRDFDLKYWPDTAELLDALADEQTRTDPEPYDSAMCAAVGTRSHSIGDFVRAVLTDLSEGSGLPEGFALSAASLARVANAALELDAPLSAEAATKHASRSR
ncbi:MAG: hypothetical protein EOM91_24090 [Sphingobacteriia bacterium]|nr:hypothetical protein [Sphingobacteriia bacterium]